MRKILHFCLVLLSLSYMACTQPVDGGEEVATYLAVTPSEITFVADAENSFIVDADSDWVAITSSDITLSTISGKKGLTTVRILAMTASSTQTIMVRTPSNTALVGTVKVYPDDGSGPSTTPGVTLYCEDFDGDTS